MDFFSNDKGIAEWVPVFCTYELIILFKCDENVKTSLFAKKHSCWKILVYMESDPLEEDI